MLTAQLESAINLRQRLARSMELNGDEMYRPATREALADYHQGQGCNEMSEISAKEFGMLQAQVAQLLESNKLLNETVLTLATSMHSMQLQMAEAKGGWKVLMLFGGASAGLGSLVSWALSNFHFGR